MSGLLLAILPGYRKSFYRFNKITNGTQRTFCPDLAQGRPYSAMGMHPKCFYYLKKVPRLPSSRSVIPNTNPAFSMPSSWVATEGGAAPHSGPGWQHPHPHTFRGHPRPRCLVSGILPAGTVACAADRARGGACRGGEAVPARWHSASWPFHVPFSSMTDRGHLAKVRPPRSPVTAVSSTHNLTMGVQLICYLVGRDSFKQLCVYLVSSFPSLNRYYSIYSS